MPRRANSSVPRDPSPRSVRRAQARAEHRRARLALFALLGTVAVYAAVAVMVTISAASAAASAERSASRAQRRLTPKGILAGRPIADLRRSRAQFRTAAARTRNPLLGPVRALPVAGRQIRAVHAIAASAAAAAGAALDATVDARELVTRHEHPTGADRVALLQGLSTIARRAQRRIDTTDLGPSRGLVPAIARAHNRLAARLDRADRALSTGAAAGEATARLLAGPSRYLVVAANNSEMRAGSGMWLQGGELSANGGAISLTGMRSLPDDAAVAADAVQPTGDFAARWGYLHPGREWRNLMLSPRFDASAELASRMWVAAGNQPVNGVISLDPAVLAAILHATGPVEVGGKAIRGRDVADEILHDQYLAFPTSANRDLLTRRERLGEIAAAAFTAFDRGGWDVATLAGDLGRAAAGRHLMVWSRDEAQQRAWVAAGVSGTLTPNSLLVSVENRGGNKLDRFLDVAVDARVRDATDGADVNLLITLRNQTPTGEPPYVAGPHADSGGVEGEYVGIVAVSMPANARDFQIDGVTGYAALGPDGPTQVMAIGVGIKRGAEQRVVARFHVPREGNPGGLLAIPSSARIPALSWRAGTSKWRDVGLRTLPLP